VNLRRRPPAAGCALALWSLFVLCGCSTLGFAPAQSFDEQLGYGYATYTAVLQAAASAQTAGTLSPTDVRYVAQIADQVRPLLDAARSVETTNPAGAADKLHLAVSLLTELQTWLRGRGVT
jgi:hypothetical protein